MKDDNNVTARGLRGEGDIGNAFFEMLSLPIRQSISLFYGYLGPDVNTWFSDSERSGAAANWDKPTCKRFF